MLRVMHIPIFVAQRPCSVSTASMTRGTVVARATSGLHTGIMRIAMFLIMIVALALAGWSLKPVLWPDPHPRWQAEEAAAISLLRSAIFPAQVVFQSALSRDHDGDGVGEYALLSELNGRRVGSQPAGTGSCLSGALARGDLASNYRFAIWLPDGAGGAIGEPPGMEARPAGGDVAVQAQEKRFRAYAWPMAGDGGRRMFCIAEDGIVRAQPWDGTAPGWDAVSGGKGWEAPLAWPGNR